MYNKMIVRDYVVDEKHLLGFGTYAKVYRGTHTKTNKQVAIKVIPYNSNLIREISFLSTFMSSRTQGLMFPDDILFDKGNVYIVYPYFPETLYNYIIRTKYQDRMNNITLFHTLVTNLISGLYFCHQQNVRHGDIHAANILMDADAQKIELTDFGMCTYDPALPWLAWNNDYDWAYYQSPELAKCILKEIVHDGCVLDNRVDMWSLGIVIMEYGVPSFIKNRIKNVVDRKYEVFKIDSEKDAVRKSLRTSIEYYHNLLKKWKLYVMEQYRENHQYKAFYTQLFMLLQNIFVEFRERWSISKCFEFWVVRSKQESPDFINWTSKFVHILNRVQKEPIRITCRQLSAIPKIVASWYAQSHNILYTLECLRLLYDFVHVRIRKHTPASNPPPVPFYVWAKQNGDWKMHFVLAEAEWEQLHITIFGLVHKLLHGASRPKYVTDAQHEESFLKTMDYNIWSSWLTAPIYDTDMDALTIHQIEQISRT